MIAKRVSSSEEPPTNPKVRVRYENETFSTLKNLGYHFEHHDGHGKQGLSTALTILIMLAFLVDPIQRAY